MSIKLWVTLVFFAFGLNQFVEANDNSVILIKFSHVVAPDTPKGKAALRFKELSEKYTRGRVRVEIHPNSTLYKDREELEALQLGAVQMLAPSLAKFAPLGVKEFEIFDLPFLFQSKSELNQFTQSHLGKNILKKLEPKGIVGLAYWDNGFKLMSANRKLVQLADFQGVKMRIQPSVILDSQMRQLGAIPVPLAFSEVYKGFQSGIIDGTENTASNIYTQNIHTVQKFLMLSNHGYLGYAVIANKKFWDNLPKEIRTQLERAMDEATHYGNEIADKENEMALEAIKKSGKLEVVPLTEQQKLQWRAALIPVQQLLEKRIGSGWLREVRSLSKEKN